MTYELWDLVSRNMIDWFEDRQEAAVVVRAYVDADEASLVMLLEHDDASGMESRCVTGPDLVRWLSAESEPLRNSA